MRPEAPGDAGAVRAVVEAAFPTAAEADLVDALRRDPAWIPGLSMVAEAVAPADGGPGSDTAFAGRVGGYALVTRCRVGGAAALALAPVAVLPELQRRGGGGAAVRAVLGAAARRAAAGGERLVVVLGHPAYYPRFGFARASSLGVGAAFEVPDEALMALVLDGPGPVPSGTVAYPAPFGV
ncbi:GNAT family N-acetyltransferase [Actinomadura bangladeshensis]|uniref:GNAT family N-acetyltransferase n=1 Tax=Actinomadura bangladeshensis TaxID=453573 RepID=UPI001FB7FA12|nr:N-acetyltransferase [Actinomadura bangladeshensis]